MDTLEEIATKLQDGDDIHTALVQSISEKASKTEVEETYLPKSSYTATDILNKLKTVDGVDSGLDADLLDGKHLSEILDSNVASATKLKSVLLTNEDLNTLKGDNYFRSYFAYGDNTCSNKPSGVSGFGLQVYNLGGNNVTVHVLTDLNTYDTYKRKGDSSWTAWKKYVTEDEVTKVVSLTQEEYDALSTKDANTLYCIPE